MEFNSGLADNQPFGDFVMESPSTIKARISSSRPVIS